MVSIQERFLIKRGYSGARTVHCTVKLGDKEHFDKEEIGVKELFTDYQPFYTTNLLLDKELLPI